MLRFIRTRERGQVLMMTLLLLPILLGMTGMAIDIGSYASHRRSLQNAADSMALAAGQELPDPNAARTKALEYAADHDIDPSDVLVVVTGGSEEPTVRVTINQPHDFVFMQIVGINEKAVGAVAAAGKFSPDAAEAVVPWSVTQDTVNASPLGAEVIIKYDAGGPAPGEGNFGAIRINGSGTSAYEEAAKYGSTYHICSTASANCTVGCSGSFPSTCAEDVPECDGPECPPKTGNMTGPTRDAVDLRTGDYTSDACDTFDEAFDPATPGGGDESWINPNCNPWSGGGCATTTSVCSRRIFLIPIIDAFGNGSSDPLTILGFALVFLEGYDGSCTGNSCDIRVRFVKADLTTASFAGAYDPDSLNHFVKLTE